MSEAPTPWASELKHIMSAPVEALSGDQRRARWQELESRFEDSEFEAARMLAQMQAFARRCFEVDAYRASRPQRYRIRGVLVEPR